MESFNLSDNEQKLFKSVTDGNISEIKDLINNLKVSLNCFDDQGMTPLQHAAFKGFYEVCKLLLDCGADVNANRHIYGYSALCLAALSNHCDTVTLLLEHGADTSTRCSNKRTASEMAAFVGHRKVVNAINNFISKDNINYFTEIHGLEKEPKLPVFLSSPLHKLIISPNIHPIRLVLHVQKDSNILKNLGKIVNVLNILSEKQLKEAFSETFSIKFHHIAFVFSSVLECLASQKAQKSEKECVADEKILDLLIKSWLKGGDNCGISVTLEKFIRRDISAYPFSDCLLFQQMARTIAKIDIGNDPNALAVLNNSINGPQSFNEFETCGTCGEQNAEKKCSACKAVQYCDKVCQKLHWVVHKSNCKKV